MTTSLSKPEHKPAKKAGFFNRLSTGTGAFDILRPRKVYYTVGIVLVVASILLIIFRGFNLGIDFAGGTKLTFTPAATSVPSDAQVGEVMSDSIGVSDVTVQRVGQSLQVVSAELQPNQIQTAAAALKSAFALPGNVVDTAVSGTWGAEVSKQAIISVIVFLVAVALFIWIRYERRSAVAAVVSTVQVLIITAGIYSLVGFELSPATVIGMLTILGFSLYDTVVVFDKVQENTRGLTSLTRRTYAEAANLAVNQTLMRSINTSLIALLPVAGLLIAGIALLGSGTLKDLALVQLVGMLVGAYSSLFVAVPLAVDLRIREPQLRAHTKRVEAKRAAEGLIVDAVGDPIGSRAPVVAAKGAKSHKTLAKAGGAAATVVAEAPVKPAKPAVSPVVPDMAPGEAPRPGVRPAGARPKRPSGKAARPTGKRGR
ncbi:protein translocase subunit SecF [Nakamurella lactea]|uniref:protein translocase subunit SecF n=1 Tax=Nakamurella lactea TaxID=459515 RepID=UPI000417873B|nr:protein translocase subunit SecF [Nakamurella lactea]